MIGSYSARYVANNALRYILSPSLYHRILWLFTFVVVTMGASWATSKNTTVNTTCGVSKFDEEALVARIIDGDTVILRDGRHVRFIGINTPEIGRKGKSSQPYAHAAKRELEKIINKERAIGLVFDQERYDKYKRLLAHVYLDKHTSISALLLRQGLATTLVIPPNIALLDCYRLAEREARVAGHGIWGLEAYQAKSSLSLVRSAKGYTIITGIVEKVGTNRRGFWLDLKGLLSLKINKDDMAYFSGYKLRGLVGKSVTVRGWIHRNKWGLWMRIRHPAAIEVMQ